MISIFGEIDKKNLFNFFKVYFSLFNTEETKNLISDDFASSCRWYALRYSTCEISLLGQSVGSERQESRSVLAICCEVVGVSRASAHLYSGSLFTLIVTFTLILILHGLHLYTSYAFWFFISSFIPYIFPVCRFIYSFNFLFLLIVSSPNRCQHLIYCVGHDTWH